MGECNVISTEAIRSALMAHFPLVDNAHIHEAPMTPDRGGRKLDVLVLNCWKSRGYVRIGIEIKRTIGDFRSELANPDKADWWVDHTHQFFIAAPSMLANRIATDHLLPVTWGLLAVSDKGAVRQLVGAPKRKTPEPIPPEAWIGIVRAASDTGATMLQRRYDEGHKAGIKQAEAAFAVQREALPPTEAERVELVAQAGATMWELDRKMAELRRVLFKLGR